MYFIPQFFIFVAKGFIKALANSKRKRIIVQGIKFSRIEIPTHILFIDDVYIFCFS